MIFLYFRMAHENIRDLEHGTGGDVTTPALGSRAPARPRLRWHELWQGTSSGTAAAVRQYVGGEKKSFR